MLEKGSKRANFARRCEINFLPLVHLDFDLEHKGQQLTCRSNIPGYAPCPKLRSFNETSGIICDHMRDNTRRCETTHETIQSARACRVFEICDHAVLLSGGWNRYGALLCLSFNNQTHYLNFILKYIFYDLQTHVSDLPPTKYMGYVLRIENTWIPQKKY